MNKKQVLILFLTFSWTAIYAQSGERLDSLSHELAIATGDTNHVHILNNMASEYRMNKPDSGIYYGNKAQVLARKIKFPQGELTAMYYVVHSYRGIGDDAKALKIALEGLKIADINFLYHKKGPILSQIGHIYEKSKNYLEAMRYFRESKLSYDADKNYPYSARAQNYIGDLWLKLNQPDSSLYYCQLSYNKIVSLNKDLVALNQKGWLVVPLVSLGKIGLYNGDANLALTYFKEAEKNASEAPLTIRLLSNVTLAQYYQQIEKLDSASIFAHKSLEIALEAGFLNRIVTAATLLSSIYEDLNLQKSLDYNKMAIAYKDSVINLSRLTSLANLIDFDEQERLYEMEADALAYKNKIRQYALIVGLAIFLLIAFILYWNNHQKQKANLVLGKTLTDLKSTQAQLIQSEKMASLGELTAGIAHEIQNPLNFVNNFSEVSGELIQEIKDERHKTQDERDEGLEDEILTDIEQNLQKINHHGNRASSIVKGMLEHSRTSSGKKELVDINALADEYLRLSYHGLRAKDKSFNADFKTDFDEKLPKIEVVSQDIGRVLLNLINNAFQASSEEAMNRKLNSDENEAKSDRYKPTVTVTTKLTANGQLLIAVKDNGSGIPDEIKDKIFQPFFTTKDTGKGTGLGLSLAYDIVKAHGGELTVKSEVGVGTEFKIILPLK